MRLGLRSWLRDSPVVALVYIIWQMSNRISVAYWVGRISGWRPSSRFYGYYVLGWLAALVLILRFAPASGTLAVALGWLALYRLQDLFFGTISDAFIFQSSAGSWQSKVVMAIMNLAQVVIIFAIAFLVFTPGTAFHPAAPPSRFGHLYLSWNILPVLGSGFTAATVRARVLVMIESAVGFPLAAIALGRLVSGLGSGAEASEPDPAARPRGS